MNEENSQTKVPHSTRLVLADLLQYVTGSIVSRTLTDKKTGTITIFAFDAGQGLSEHSAPFDAVVQVVEGELELKIGDEQVQAEAGEVVIMPADIPHSLQATTPTKMLLVMIR